MMYSIHCKGRMGNKSFFVIKFHVKFSSISLFCCDPDVLQEFLCRWTGARPRVLLSKTGAEFQVSLEWKLEDKLNFLINNIYTISAHLYLFYIIFYFIYLCSGRRYLILKKT